MYRGKAAVVLKGDATCFLFLLLAELTASGFGRSMREKVKGRRGEKQLWCCRGMLPPLCHCCWRS